MLAMKPTMGAMGTVPYDLEKGQKLDFDALLKTDAVKEAAMVKGDGAAPPSHGLQHGDDDLDRDAPQRFFIHGRLLSGRCARRRWRCRPG